jgi:hypothetical protein
MTTDGRVRLSRMSVLEHTGQWQPIIGTPALVPLPRKSNSIDMRRIYSAGGGANENGPGRSSGAAREFRRVDA